VGRDRKIVAIGVRISSGFTWHGLAFNIDPDLGTSSTSCHAASLASRGSGHTHLKNKKGRSLTEATPFAPNLTECYMQVTLHRLDGILRSCKILMVFSGYGDLLMVRDQIFLNYISTRVDVNGLSQTARPMSVQRHKFHSILKTE
jgi:hypothetical protein